MRKDDLQYFSDSIIMESLFQNQALTKEAGVISDLVTGITGTLGGTILNEGKKLFANKSGSEIAETLMDFVASGILWRISPILSILNSVAKEVFDFNLTDIAKSIVSSLYSDLTSGSVSPSKINEAAKISTGSLNSLLAYDIIKEARGSYNWENLKRGLRNVPRYKGKGLFGAIIGWLLRNLLIGGGVTMAAGIGSSLLGVNKEHKKTEESQPNESEPTNESHQEEHVEEKPKPNVRLKPSGRGEQYFANDDRNIWIIPVINGNLTDTLTLWAIDIYPELKNMEEEIKSSPDFNKAINILKKDWKLGATKLEVPKGYNSRKEIVDIFAGSI